MTEYSNETKKLLGAVEDKLISKSNIYSQRKITWYDIMMLMDNQVKIKSVAVFS